MTLHTYDRLEQGTPEWHDVRRGIVTASVVGKLLTPTLKVASNDESRGLTATLAAERISGYTDPTYMNADMFRGVEEEPIARDLYSKHCQQATEVGFMVREEDDWTLGFSPDGLVGEVGLIEIKSRRQKKHLQTILADGVPPENMAQLQAGLLVSGRKWIDYVSFCSGLPLYVRRVYPDPKWFDAITAAAQTFEQNVVQMVADYRAATQGMPATERIIELEMSL